jgi:hypothetical protein
MKKTFVVVGGIIVLGVAYWLLSPLFISVTLDEEIPGNVAPSSTAPIENVENALPPMDAATKADFEKQMTEMADKVMEGNDSMPPEVAESGPKIVAQAPMLPEAHEVEGTALIIDSLEGVFLRFEDLDTVNGPDLRIYLSADLDANDFVDLGKIRATKGNVNYSIPPDTDLEKYKIVMIWCKPFGVLFSYAEF